MTDWLLGANVLSGLRRSKPEPTVVAFVSAEPLDRLYVSTVTIAEIRFGVERVADPAPIRARAETPLKSLAQRCFELLLERVARRLSADAPERHALKIWMGLHGLVMLAQQDLIDHGPVRTTVAEMIDTLLE